MTRIQQWSQKLRMPHLLVLYWLWTISLTLLSLLYTEFMIHVIHSHTTLRPLVLWNDERWWDFLVFKPRFDYFHTPLFWSFSDQEYPFTYPAPMALVFAALYKIPHALRWYLPALIATLLAGAYVLARRLAQLGYSFPASFVFAASIPALAWPVWLLLGSANLEGVVAILVAGGTFAFLRRRWWLSATFFAVAGSLKIFPLAMLALLLSRRRYKQFGFGLLLSALIDLGSLAILGPTIAEAQRHISAGLVFVRQIYALNPSPWALDVSHSLFSPTKFLMLLVFHALHPNAAPATVIATLVATFNVYMVVVTLSALSFYVLCIRRLPILNQLLAITICAVLLPPYSVDYTLIHLFVPFGLLCLYATEAAPRNPQPSGLLLCFACFAFIFPISTFFTLYYRFGSLVRMAALTTLLVAVSRYRFPWPQTDGECA